MNPSPVPDCPLCRGDGMITNAFGSDVCPCVEQQKWEDDYKSAISRMQTGRRECSICGGRGGSRVNGKWIKCSCTRLTKLDKQVQRALNSVGARGEQLTLNLDGRGDSE